MNRGPLIHFSVALALVALLIGGYVFAYLAVGGANTEAGAALGALAEKESARARALEARSTLSDLAADETFIGSHFVKTEDIVPFLESFERIGRTYGATVAVASVSDSTEGGGTVLVSLSLQGSFDAVMRTLGAIEHGVYAVRTKSATLERGSDRVWSAVGSFAIGASAEIETP